MKESKKPTRLKHLMETWNPAKPKLMPKWKTRPNAVPTATLIKPTKDRTLVRFRESFAKQKPISEAKAYDAEIAGTSLIVIDKNRTSTEMKEIVEGLAQDCMDMSNDGHTVMAIAVAYD